jgi:hypothetical protein
MRYLPLPHTIPIVFKVKIAPSDFSRIDLLLNTITSEAAKDAKADVAFLAWAMSCLNELATGKQENRTEVRKILQIKNVFLVEPSINS